ncbi:MAG: nucleotidyltransferase family protein [Dehalococcoidia bacterium]
MTVTRAVVLAAGRGTRLGALTAATPKPLLEVGGRPILLRILDGLAAAGITDLALVTGYLGGPVRDAVLAANLPLHVTWAEQHDLRGTAAAVQLARDVLGDGPFFFGWGDIVVHSRNYAAIVAAGAEGPALAVNEVDDPWAGAAVYVTSGGLVSQIVEKPAPGSSTTRWNNAGLGVLDGRIWPAIEALTPSSRGELELPRAIASLVGSGVPVRAVPVSGPWFDIGTPESLAAARQAADNGLL